MQSLAAIAEQQSGVVLTRQFLASGFDDREIGRLVRDGHWLRLRRGALCTCAARADDPGEDGWHRLLIRAVTLALGDRPVVSHVSAAALARLPLYRAPLELVHITRPGHTSRREGGVDHHDCQLDDDELERRPDGIWTTTLARTVLDVSRSCTVPTALVIADAAMRRGLTRAELSRALDIERQWSGARGSARVLELADAGAESPGETLMRLAFDDGGLPRPLLQVEFRDDTGHVWARVDALFPEERTIVEFDGRGKYVDADALWREKLREDRLRELGYEVVRVTWADLADPVALAARIRRAFARGRRRTAA